MNCVPGMITEFAFTPVITTEEMRLSPEVQAKVKKSTKSATKKVKNFLPKAKKH